VTKIGYLVECYWPGVSAQKHAGAAQRAQVAAFELRKQGRDVSFVGSILVPVDETVFWFFDGDEEDIRVVSEQAGMPYERVLQTLRIDGD
jgi:hypothetical protein